MALNKNIVLGTGVTVPFWVARLESMVVHVDRKRNDNLFITGALRMDGYLSATHYTAGTFTPITSVLISDLTQEEIGTILKKVGKANLKKAVYNIIQSRTEWADATESLEDESE